jgi:hypothetical protein
MQVQENNLFFHVLIYILKQNWIIEVKDVQVES